ncbi:MAG: cyclic nucleotide-binding domain-containing protein [Acidobacteria bacterium]|nr:cyclic nucleotide-binding domain-containing protein [Acidobacteriota bacterium]
MRGDDLARQGKIIFQRGILLCQRCQSSMRQENDPRRPAVPAEAKAATQRLSEKLGYLSAMKIFQDLSPDEMRQLEQAISMITCQAGRVFYVPGETGEVLFLLKKGRVQLYRLSPDGRKLTVKILEPMAFFGEMAILGQGMYETFAEAMEDFSSTTAGCGCGCPLPCWQVRCRMPFSSSYFPTTREGPELSGSPGQCGGRHLQ